MKNWRFLVVFLGIMGMALAQPAWAVQQEPPATVLDETVVTGVGVPRCLGKATSAITIITADQIAEMGANNIVEAVENVPGIAVDSDSRNRLTIRGNRSVQSPGALVLIDGVPANSGLSNYVEYEAIPLANIERIEVGRSSASMAFGPDASRGVINIITKKAVDEKARINVSGRYGSWDTSEVSANAMKKSGVWDYAVGFSCFDTDGYEDDDKQRNAARFNAGYNFSDIDRLGLSLSWQDTDYTTIYGKTKWQVDNYREQSVFPTSDTNDTLVHPRKNENENVAAGLDFAHKGKDFFVNAHTSYDKTDHLYEYLKYYLDRPNIKKDYQESRTQKRFLIRANAGYCFGSDALSYIPTLGADYEDISFDQNRTYPWADDAYVATKKSTMQKAEIDAEKSRWGVYLDNDFGFGKSWEFRVGGRVDCVDYNVENKEPKKIDNDTTDFSWNVTPCFHPTNKSTIYISASQSYWYPVLIYYRYAMEKDSPLNKPEDLKSEEYLTYELGYKHDFGPKLNVALAGYVTKIDDKFLSLYEGSSWKGYKNIGSADNVGIELEAGGRLSQLFGYRLSGAWQNAEWDDAMFRAYEWGKTPVVDDVKKNLDISGKDVPHIPEFTAGAGIDFYFMEFFKLSADLNYHGKQYVDVLNRLETDDYTTFDMGLFFEKDGRRVWVLGKNIFCEDHENWFDETGQRLADGTPKALYYPSDGAYVEGGVSLPF